MTIYIYLCDLFLLDFSFVVQTCEFKLDHSFSGFEHLNSMTAHGND